MNEKIAVLNKGNFAIEMNRLIASIQTTLKNDKLINRYSNEMNPAGQTCAHLCRRMDYYFHENKVDQLLVTAKSSLEGDSFETTLSIVKPVESERKDVLLVLVDTLVISV